MTPPAACAKYTAHNQCYYNSYTHFPLAARARAACAKYTAHTLSVTITLIRTTHLQLVHKNQGCVVRSFGTLDTVTYALNTMWHNI